MLNSSSTFALTRSGETSAEHPFNAERLLIWLSNVVQFVKCMSGSQPAARGELHPTRTLRRAAFQPRASLRHPLILDGFLSAFALRADARRDSGGQVLARSI